MQRKLSLFLLPALILLVLASLRANAQQIIGVGKLPGSPYTTIQQGIDAASDGDIVEVGIGAYSENISFKGKAITVTGDYPGRSPNQTLPVILGVIGEPAVVFQTGETRSSVLSYFNIVSGGAGTETSPPGPYVGLPGAIYISGTSPTIANNVITQSACYGIYVDSGAPLIQYNELDTTTLGNNCFPPPASPSSVTGGEAIRVTGDTPPGPTLIYGNLIQNNTNAGGDGLAVPGGGGSGITLAAPAIVQNNTIRNNVANYSVGGGIKIEDGPGVFIIQNLIYGNSAQCGGGGIALPGASTTPGIIALIANNTIVDNAGYPITSPSFSPNCAAANQLFAYTNVLQNAGPHVVIVNNILSDSIPDAGPDANCAPTLTPDQAFQSIFDHNILYNVSSSFFGPNCVDVSSKYNNLTADPRFNNPTTNDYTLTQGSPAIDAGNTSFLQLFQQLSGLQPPTTDFNGTGYPRVIDATGKGYPIIDIGAFEYPDQIVTSPPPITTTTMVLTYTQVPDAPALLSVQTQSLQGTPTGPVSFFADGAPLRTSNGTVIPPATINGSGIAAISGFTLAVGTHVLSATYPGTTDGKFTPAAAIINVIVSTLIPTNLDIDDNYPNKDIYPHPFLGTPITFTVTTHANDGTRPTPVTLTDVTINNPISLPTVYPDPVTGQASFTVSTLSLGQHDIEATYAGTSIYAPSGNVDTVTVEGFPTTITLTCNGHDTSAALGATIPLVATVTSPYGTPTGTVGFKQDGADLASGTLTNGIATSTAVTKLGYNIFTAFYAGSNGFASSSSIPPCQVSVVDVSLSVSSSANPSPAFSPITFTATLAGTPIPPGKYSLNISIDPPVASIPPITATMTASADGSSATYTATSGLAPGTYDVSVTFIPSDGSTPTTASLIPQQVVTAASGDFTLTGPSTLTIPTEGTATGTLTLTSIDNFSGPITLTCNLPLPTTYTCKLTPTSATLTVNGVATATVTLAPNNLRAANNPHTSRIILATLFPLTLLSLIGLSRRKHLRSLICLAFMTMVTITLTSCGKDIFYVTTQPGSYPLTITATGTTKGATTPTTHTLNITLNLTQ